MAESPIPPSFSGPTVDPDHPWLGLDPFSEVNQRYFFGRTAEVREIFLLVRECPLTILFGRSGLGKTSLLRAGLIPKLRVERFRPAYVRLDFSHRAMSLVEQMRAALAEVCAGPSQNVAALSARWAPLGSLWEICAHKIIRPPELSTNPPALIIDQFEEVFTLGEAWGRSSTAQGTPVADLFRQIGDLVENRAPGDLQTSFRHDPERALIYDFGPKTIRVIISLREDFLAQLEKWKDSIPSLTRNRLGLQALTGPQALEAAVRPGRIEGRNLLSDRVGKQIVRFVAQRPDDVPLDELEAVPPLVSLVCEQLNAARLEAKPPQDEISAELVESQGKDILQRFYDDTFDAFPDAQREAVRRYVEGRMVTVGGHRNPVAEEDAVVELANMGISEPTNVLNALIARRLLTAERRGGIQRLEITHDVLVPLVVRSRKEREERYKFEEAKRRVSRFVEEASKVFVSYAWGDASLGASESDRKRHEVIERMCETLEMERWQVVRDKTTLRYGDQISTFMQTLGQADLVIVVLSAKYLQSPYCMAELHALYQNARQKKREFLSRIIPLVLDDARIGTPEERVKHAKFWEARCLGLKADLDYLSEEDFRLYQDMKDWYNHVGRMLGFVNDVLSPHGFENIVQNEFAALRQMLQRVRSERSP